MPVDPCNAPSAEPAWSGAVAARIGRTVVDISGLGWLEAIERLSLLEGELLPLVRTDADRREVGRRICEAIIVQLSTSQPAPDASAYDGIWKRMLDLGFTNDERRMSMHVFRLMYLIDNGGGPEQIDAELSRFGEEVEALRARDPALAKSFSGAHARLANRVPMSDRHGGGALPGAVPATEWKFLVRGSVCRAGDDAPLRAYDVIVTPDTEVGPHALTGRGPIAHPDEEHSFHTWFVTEGADRAIETPSTVLVYLRVARNEWKPYTVPIRRSEARVISRKELDLLVGEVRIERDQQVYVPGSGDAE